MCNYQFDLTGVSVEDIIRKVAMYFELDNGIHSRGKSVLEKRINILRELYNCEFWLAEQFCVKTFKSLGFGEFLMFLEKHASLLPDEIHKFLTGDICEKSPLEVCMLQHQLFVLVSQALNGCIGEKEIATKQMISSLLRRQFPLISFKISENGSVSDFLDILGKHKNNVISKGVLFSVTLFEMCDIGDSTAHNGSELLETMKVRIDISQKGALESRTSKDAVEALLRAPLMSDLNTWAHWDLVFAPSLGPLVPWLLNEVNTKELLCLVTKDGKVLRIDHSATVDSFLEAALQGSPFQTAVQLLSLFSLVGGEKYVPLSLLKCHARHAFEVILKNSLESGEVNDNRNSLMQGNTSYTQKTVDEADTHASSFSSELHKSLCNMNKAVPVVSRFFLDCLGYLPTEFCGFAADVLLSGMRSVIKDANSAILCECNQREERVMLHEVGLSLGIVEWIDDYHAFCSVDATNFFPFGASCLEAAGPEKSIGLKNMQDLSSKSSTSKVKLDVTLVADGQNEEHTGVCQSINGALVFDDRISSGRLQRVSELNEDKNAALVIESIRQDEFGLDPSLSNTEISMLKKQHARLGRALHCLSQELYSQDSHFLLELVRSSSLFLSLRVVV